MLLEEMCVGHITPRHENCRDCSIDNYNLNCPYYKSRKQAIEDFYGNAKTDFVYLSVSKNI